MDLTSQTSHLPECNNATSSTDRSAESIAIIGVGCRFPGQSNTPDAFWRLLKSGQDAMVDIPEDRWGMNAFFSADKSAPGKMYVRKGGFLKEPVDSFDPLFFGISPREAMYMDPQQRILLEIAWEALEDAGLVATKLAGTDTGVYIGGFTLDSLIQQMSPLNRENIGTHSATGASMTMLANRLSYCFDFRGPSISIDTACSSSLVAFHYACHSLWRGESSLALAGGVNIMLRPEYPIVMCKGQFLSPDGYCKSFDARANGYSRGEGAGIVVLKPLSAALRDGDDIYARVCGTGVNQDGRTEGITVPSSESQEALIRDVYSRAKVAPELVSYVEAHGTGTPVGDPIEASALGMTIGSGRSGEHHCVVGSVKANIGHLEAAAGIAGVIKAALCLKHGQIPPLANLEQPNPDIPFENLGLRLPWSLQPMPETEGISYVGVNSFGYGGTNAHAILQQPPATNPLPDEDDEKAHGPCLLPISSRDGNALTALARYYLDWLSKAQAPSLKELCYSASLRRSHHDHRLAITADSVPAVIEQLQTFLEHGRGEQLSTGRTHSRQVRQPVFVFTGMGPQWWAMGRELLAHEPVFRRVAEQCDEVFKRIAGWSVIAEMLAEETDSRINETQIAQPAIFVLQVALAELLRAWGIQPAAIVGHSVGEVAAAYFAGVLNLEDAVRVSYHRSRLQQKAAGKGKMLAVGLQLEELENLLAGNEQRVSVAAINSVSAVTLSGDSESLEGIAARLEKQGVFNRFLKVEVAYHSPHMDALEHELIESLQGLETHAPAIALYSTVSGQRVEGTGWYDPQYWYKNIRQSVVFAKAVGNIIEQGHSLFLEIGPHPVLAPSIKECLYNHGTQGQVLASLRRKEAERKNLLKMLGELYTLGYDIDWHRLYPTNGRYVKLPTYPWQRERYWYETPSATLDRMGNLGHPLLGTRLPAPDPSWQTSLNSNYVPYLADHTIEGNVVFPAAAYAEAALAIHGQLSGKAESILEDLEFNRVLVVDPEKDTILRWTYDAKTSECQVYSRAKNDEDAWTPHAMLRISSGQLSAADRLDMSEIKDRCKTALDTEDFYQRLATYGLDYGDCFQGISQLWCSQTEVLAKIAVYQEGKEEAETEHYHLHPTLLDAAFQSLFAVMVGTNKGENGAYLPVYIRQLRYYGKPPRTQCWSYGRLNKQTQASIEGDVVLCDEHGEIFAEVRGLQCQAIVANKKTSQDQAKQWIYQYEWENQALDTIDNDPRRWLLFMDHAGIGDCLAGQLAARGAKVIRVMAGANTRFVPNITEFQIRRNNLQDMAELISRPELSECDGVVYLWGLDSAGSDEDVTGLADTIDCLHLAQAMAGKISGESSRMYIVTRDLQCVQAEDKVDGLAQAPLGGLGRVIASEHPELNCSLIDIGADEVANEAAAIRQELLASSAEDDVAWRGMQRYVHRLVNTSWHELEGDAEQQTKPQPASDRPFKLEVGIVGSTESLQFSQIERVDPGPGEVEVEIRAAALNFKDVLKVLGMLPDKALAHTFHANNLGMEASGVVSRVGEGVQDYHVDDEIVVSLPGCFSSHVTLPTSSLFSVPKLEQLSHEQAASLPVIFMTAYYGLHELAHLRPGEKVLIHAAAGGVGLAAIQVAQWLGAEAFATAGSQEKQDYLRSLGIKHIMHSRTMDFSEQIMEITGGRGVDVVLNSLPGEALSKSLSVLAPFGRFIEIGKRDIVENNRLQMLPFNKSLSFTAFDLDRMMLERPELIRRILEEVWQRFRAGDFVPPPIKVFRASEIADAFRYMVQSKQMGKIVVSLQDVAELPIQPLVEKTVPVKADGSYLITGGFGGFGLEVALLLARQGVRHIVLAGRKGANTIRAQQAVEQLLSHGVDVLAAAVDVSEESQVEKLIADITETMPPLKGIFHAAGVLDDRLLMNINEQSFNKVMAPKADAAWYLHKHTLTSPLDSFIMFSSVSAIIGNPGQANYAAANLFLDSLAQYRRSRGLVATSINWGALADVGMAAKSPDVTEHLSRMGIHAFAPAQAMDILSHIMTWNKDQLGVMDVNWAQLKKVHPIVTASPRFCQLLNNTQDLEQSSHAKELRANLLAIDPENRVEVLALALAELVAETLRMPSDKVDIHQSFSDMGIDSLTAMELQTSINTKVGIEISMIELIRGDSIISMTEQLLKKMNILDTTVTGIEVLAEDEPSERQSDIVESSRERPAEVAEQAYITASNFYQPVYQHPVTID